MLLWSGDVVIYLYCGGGLPSAWHESVAWRFRELIGKMRSLGSVFHLGPWNMASSVQAAKQRRRELVVDQGRQMCLFDLKEKILEEFSRRLGSVWTNSSSCSRAATFWHSVYITFFTTPIKKSCSLSPAAPSADKRSLFHSHFFWQDTPNFLTSRLVDSIDVHIFISTINKNNLLTTLIVIHTYYNSLKYICMKKKKDWH